MTEFDFTETLAVVTKDTSPGLAKVKYSVLKNMPEDEKASFFHYKKKAAQKDKYHKAGHTVIKSHCP